MRRRYDLNRSDNYPVTDRVVYPCVDSGTLAITLGFSPKSVTLHWATVPAYFDEHDYESYSSSSSSSFDSSSSSSSNSSTSSSSSSDSSTSSSSSSSSSQSSSSFDSSSSSSSSSIDSSSSSSSSSFDSSSSSSSTESSSTSSSSDPAPTTTTTTTPAWILPRLYVSSYTSTGFIVTYENIREDIGYIDFTYYAV